MNSKRIRVDVLIFGGGVAGLWLLDELVRRGNRVLLLETTALGHGQTIASQGIIHGGLKYMFDGNLNAPARAISEMPGVWRECLAGSRLPNLAGTVVRSEGCYIWGTGSIKSRIFMSGSTLALRTAPVAVEKTDWPAALTAVPGKVLRVAEQVLDPVSLLTELARPHLARIAHIDGARPPEFERDDAGRVTRVKVYRAGGGQSVEIEPAMVVLTAGEGNSALRERIGLAGGAMQRRPLHMVMARGELPELYGHCVGGAKPRVTVTTNVDSQGRRVWLMGGQIAEDGVKLEREALIRQAAAEVAACLPGVSLRGVEMATYRVDRAEAATTTGQRPDDVHLVREGNVITAWPTKLALAPRLAERVAGEVEETAGGDTVGAVGQEEVGWPAPGVASPPWELAREWSETTDEHR